MSTHAAALGRDVAAQTRHADRRPGWGRLAWSAFCGMVRGTLVLYVTAIALTLAGVAPFVVSDDLYSPFVVSSSSSALAALAWAVFVVAVMTPFVADAIDDGVGRTVSRGWLALSLATAGYAADAIFANPDDGTAIPVAVVLMAVLTRWVVLLPDGTPRGSTETMSWMRLRSLMLVAFVALTVVVGYTATHPLRAQPTAAGDGTASESGREVLAGPSTRVSIQFEVGSWVPLDVVGAEPILEGGGLQITGSAIGRDLPFGGRALELTSSRPVRVGGRKSFSVGLTLRQAPCSVGPGTLTAVLVRYRVLGADATQRVPLDRPVTRRCR